MKDITPSPAKRALAVVDNPPNAYAPPAAGRISKDITAAIDLMLDFGNLVTRARSGAARGNSVMPDPFICTNISLTSIKPQLLRRGPRCWLSSHAWRPAISSRLMLSFVA